VAGGELREYNPVEITVAGHVGRAKARALTRISGQNRNLVVFEKEELKVGADVFSRDPRTPPNRSIFQRTAWFDDWQFLDLEPARMGLPASRTRSDAAIRLLHTGDNLAEYLRGLREVPGEGALAFEGLVDALRVILPYARDLDVDQREGFEREIALRLTEGSFTVPGWMLSTGTLRLVALLALLRHPRPPSLLCVEEIENGLDPRTVHLVVRELLRAADSGRTQIMVTTHSPYLLDLVPLESLVLVARDGGEPPRFDRPNDHEEVREWAKRFTLGNLYTMGTLHQRRDR
jgi:predicted ATPase